MLRRAAPLSNGPQSVMAGLVPAIHVFRFKDVDARHEAGHDDSELIV